MRHSRIFSSSALSKESGFTLLEAFIAIALMSVLLGTLATVTGHWLRNWKAGLERVQDADLLALGLDRIAADLAAAEYEGPGGENARPLFMGMPGSVTFVRSAIGPNAAPGLEFVRLEMADDARGRVLVRLRAPFMPLGPEAISSGAVAFANPVVLIRPPYHITFAYAGADRVWRDTWQNAKQLPDAVRISVRNGQTGEILPASTATLLNVNAPPQAAAGNPAASAASDNTGDSR
ncbi:MAG TPA: prepilin-type N-terminal cleavage/methylation domain-containing protein [Methylocella sp.]|nr:prepilin-type N-terminal cleavage/methylation domain-containing protein [Methylocella sp.]